MKIKNKKLPIILGALGVVAVTSIGFATWIVGVQTLTKDHNITVNVDGYEDNGIILDCIANNDTTITLAETVTGDGTGKAVTATGTGDFEIQLSAFQLSVSDSYLAKNNITSVSYVVTGLPTVKVSSTDTFGRTQKDYDYIQLANAEIPFSEFGAGDKSTISGWTVYDFKTKNPSIKFDWGNYFDLTTTAGKQDSPAEFYNANIKAYDSSKPSTDVANKDTLAKWSKASEELGAMAQAFNGKTIKVQVKVNATPKAA